ncbi:putative acetyl-CoA acyltransferase [Caenibius tardaugens NBRC 16725]|uniref:Putative acetyl-CoA acyltransferase n=1 Tax=Caenibius tardaugens NBRC 16725 TaxID=1219035 RepID=U2YQ86_9SPHN|nr:acetyl-CoA C-acetyltransferase [Caenibius tardaugens]AZI35510.1 acetyl-CoA C-acetyltransferase [Caenibius tardaugens NBRC 16725]GAD51120.1 putative acetyl-CoA acyltransferase [Caenibius tardaugens NBRC 16725]
MTHAYIYDAVRTPRGKGRPDGALHEITALDLAAQMLRALRDRNHLDTALVDDVVLGCVMPVGEQGSDIARLATVVAGYEQQVPGVQVNRFCASGLEACNIAAAKVIAGEARFAVGGGVESMSRVPLAADGGAMTVDPVFAFDHYYAPQGIGADMIATLNGFTRDDVDAYAVQSQQRAATAWREGRFAGSIVPVLDQAGAIRLAHDEHMRPDTDLQALGKLKPAFVRMGEAGYDAVAMARYPDMGPVNHVHHGGNSSGIVDGAAMVLIGSKEAGEAAGLKPRARILGGASIGSEPTIMLTGPEFVTRKLLNRLGMATGDIDIYELNEAFAAVVLRYLRALELDGGTVNVNGGAIAMGHPLGATGAMILGTALDELERTDKQTALINLCVGAGMGTAMVIERI